MSCCDYFIVFFFSSRRRHTRYWRDWSSDVCSSDLQAKGILMLLTNCREQVAFELLTHISSHTHRKVRDVAQALTASAAGEARLPGDVAAILRDACPPDRHVG